MKFYVGRMRVSQEGDMNWERTTCHFLGPNPLDFVGYMGSLVSTLGLICGGVRGHPASYEQFHLFTYSTSRPFKLQKL
jgi:hypothetical protein